MRSSVRPLGLSRSRGAGRFRCPGRAPLSRSLAGSLALLFAVGACAAPPPKPTPTNEKAPAVDPFASAMAAVLAPRPSAAPSAAPAPSADPAPTASAVAAAAPSSSAEAPATSVASAPSGSAAAGAAKAPRSSAPNPKSGILGKAAADKILAQGAASIVKLFEAGDEPRAAMAYTFHKDQKQALKVSLDMTMGLKAGVRSLPPTPIPRLSMTLDLTAGDGDPGGDFHIDAMVRGIEVEAKKAGQDAEIAAAMRPHLEGMKGLSMGYWVSPQGSVRDVKIALPSKTNAAAQQALSSMNQSFESIVTPLPKEPIGVGAQWEVVSRVSSSGADILQFATYTLKSRDGTRASLEVSLKQVAADDRIDAPGLPPGVSARLRSFRSGGKGSTSVETKSIAPEAGRLDLKSSMDVEVSEADPAGLGGGGQPQRMSVDSTLGVTFSRPPK